MRGHIPLPLCCTPCHAPLPVPSPYSKMRRLVTVAAQSTTLIKTAAVTVVESVTDASGPLTSSPQLATYAWRSFAAGGTLGGMPADSPDIDTKTTPSAAPDVTPDRGCARLQRCAPVSLLRRVPTAG